MFTNIRIINFNPQGFHCSPLPVTVKEILDLDSIESVPIGMDWQPLTEYFQV